MTGATLAALYLSGTPLAELTTPALGLGKWGIYDEDAGFETRRGLQAVDDVSPGAAYQIREASEAYTRHVFGGAALPGQGGPGCASPCATGGRCTLTVGGRIKTSHTVHVPPAREGEAQALVQSIGLSAED